MSRARSLYTLPAIGAAMAMTAVLALLATAALAQGLSPESAVAVIDAALKAHRAGDTRAALGLLRAPAERGDADAQFTYGQILEASLDADARSGDAVAAEVAAWYLRAARAGHAGAMNNLGALYFDGQGVTIDLAAAREWYERAANAGYALSQYNLALMYGRGRGVPRDDARMAAWLERAASAGYDRAQAQLGRLYLDGTGVAVDPVTAAKWYRLAAMQGNPQAQFQFGMLLHTGAGVARDFDQALLWLRRAADQAHPLAAWELAQVHEMGLGVDQSDERALRFYETAGAANLIPAIERVLAVYRDGGLGQQPDAALASFWSLKLRLALGAIRDGRAQDTRMGAGIGN